MKKQNGFGILVFLGVLALIAGSLFLTCVTYHNQAVRYEGRIKMTYANNQNIMSNYTATIQEMMQLPDAYRDDLMKLVEATFQGRYGNNGSQATMQWIQERNLSLDPDLYRSVQNKIEAGRNEFAMNQTALLDVKRAYFEVALKSFWSGMWMRWADFPTFKSEDYDIIILQDTRQKFQNKTDEVIKLR